MYLHTISTRHSTSRAVFDQEYMYIGSGELFERAGDIYITCTKYMHQCVGHCSSVVMTRARCVGVLYVCV